MQVYLKTTHGFYICGINKNKISFSNKRKFAISFNKLPFHIFKILKEEIEELMKGELEISFEY